MWRGFAVVRKDVGLFALLGGSEFETAGTDTGRTVGDAEADKIGLTATGKIRINLNRCKYFLPGLVDFD